MTSLLKNDDHVTPAKATKSSFITQDQSEPISSNPKKTSFLMSDDQTTSTKVKKDDQTTSTFKLNCELTRLIIYISLSAYLLRCILST